MSIKNFFVVVEELAELLTIETSLEEVLERAHRKMRGNKDIKTALSHQKWIIKEISSLTTHYETDRRP